MQRQRDFCCSQFRGEYTQNRKGSSGFNLPVVAGMLDDHPLPVARRTVHFKFLSQLCPVVYLKIQIFWLVKI